MKQMLKTTRKTRRLVSIGIKPRAWGLAAMGCSPTMAKTLRGSIIKGLGIRKAGGCATMALATHGYSQRDQWITFSIENMTHFLEAWISAPAHISMGIRAVWAKTLEKNDRPQRWQHVCGPLGAAVATLLDWGFYPADYNRWVDPSGGTWTFDIKDPNIVASAREVLAFHFGNTV